MTNVYLAGKITKNGWRSQFVPDLRSQFSEYEDYRNNHDWPSVDIGDGLTYVGPFFVADDHGCFHGPRSHGFGADGAACGGAYEPPYQNHGLSYWGGNGARTAVVDRCLDAIRRADLVIAIIDEDAHGTITELGYAAALNKNICIADRPACTDGCRGPFGVTTNDETWFPRHLPNSWSICCVDWILEKARGATRREREEKACASPIELAFLRSMRRHDKFDAFTPNLPVAEGKYRIDFADPDRRIGVELDGYAYHSDKDTFVKDRRRQRELENLGWRLIRFAGKEVHDDPDTCVAQFGEWLDAQLAPAS